VPTRNGWLVGGGSIALVVVGRLFGIFELHLVAAAGFALVIGSVVSVRRAKLRLEVSRALHPPRLHAGAPSRVELRVTNRGARRTPLLTLRDPVGEGRSARVLLAPLRNNQNVRAAYNLPTEERGVVTIGPLDVEVSDPFGIATLSTLAASTTDLTVWPAVDEVTPLPHTQGDEPHGGVDHPNALRSTGEDFYALRPYVEGDDLRRVHWASTARRDELMVRQDEMPWQGRATILLDTRRGAFGGRSFERAVSAAASLVVAANRRQFLIRLVTAAGLDTGFGAGGAHVEAAMEHLAVVRTSDHGNLAGTFVALRRAGNGGAIAALLGARAPSDVAAASRLRTAYGHTSVVVFGTGRLDRATFGANVVLVDDANPFGPAWDAALGLRRGAAPRRSAAASSASAGGAR